MSKDLNQDPNIENPLDAEQDQVDKVEVNTELSKLATNPKRNIAILAVVVVILGYIAYQIFTSTATPSISSVDAPLARPDNVIKPVLDQDSYIPPLPELPKIESPRKSTKDKSSDNTSKSSSTPTEDPPAPPPTIDIPLQPIAPSVSSLPSPSLPSVIPSSSVDEQKRLEAKRKSNVLLVGGSGVQTQENLAEAKMKNDFTYRGSLSYVLGKGKIIDAVMESAVNTDFPGEVIALVSRDIYSENGKVILIPKGSRIFGSSSSASLGGADYGRIDIVWNRIDLPSGYSLNLDGTTVDGLSRKGIQGRVDNKYKERITNAVLSSSISILIAAGLDKVVPPPATSTTTATQNALSSSITTAATNAYSSNSSAGAPAQISAICNAVQTLPGVISSPGYASIQSACATAIGVGSSATDATVSTLLSAITSSAGNLSVSAANASTPSQQQKASQDAFKDLTDQVKNMLTKDDSLKPTTTLNQGERIKIYVNRDYNFPPQALNQSRLIQ